VSATGKLDRPGGSLCFEVIDATPPWAGEAPLIVFHHGIGATAEVWAEWLPALLDRYRVARFDMLGFGRSGVPGPGFPWSLEGLMADAPPGPSASTSSANPSAARSACC
jgi:pimeloyl-ACP methyl ester carboxylesterase